MDAKGSGRATLVYLFALSAGTQNLTAATVFYEVRGEAIAQSLCTLFDGEYAHTDGHPSFHWQAADTVSPHDQILLEEALEQLAVYANHGPTLYDPAPPKDALLRARYALRARRWEHLLRRRISREGLDPPGILPRPVPPAVEVGAPGAPCSVLGKQKRPLTDGQRAVVAALMKAGDEGMTKDALETVRVSARRMLRRLREDRDWAEVILLPGQTNGRYRIKA
jgi:hypothetical protein